MGKRSSFERRGRDFYPTPLKAVAPLVPFLRASGVRTFAEPCCGEGDLVRHLESSGLRCVYQSDISSGQDALTLDHYGAPDAIITNPPYDTAHRRKLMHALIEHFQHIAPTWLLIDYDWSATRQAAKYLLHCSDIVVVPRLKWFEDSDDTGKDNHAWFRFDARHTSGPSSTTTATRPRRSHGSPESAPTAAGVTNRSDQHRASARRHASSSPIARDLA
jgi:hypothetical protein